MKIAVWHNLPSGGGKRALYNHIKVLLESGHDVEAWTTDMSSVDYLPLTDLVVENRMSVKLDFVRTYQIKNQIKKTKAQISIMQAHCKECVSQIEARGFDLIFANSCFFSYMSYIGLYSTLPTLIYLGEPYRPFFEAMPNNIWQAPIFELRLKKIKRIYTDFKINYSNRIKLREELKAAKQYNSILVNSLYSRESVIRAYGIDARVCYLGIDDDFFVNAENCKENYVIGIGKISYAKGVKSAIKIISIIPEEIRPTLKWISNGYDDNYNQEVLVLAHQLNVNFEALINLTDDEMKKVISKAAVMLYTSILEPFGLAPLEANACGTYVVAIAEGGVRESITNGENGTLIYGYDLELFAQELLRYTQDAELATNKGLNAQQFVSINWNKEYMKNNILLEIQRNTKFKSRFTL